MPKQKVLVPHNFTDYDHRALDFVARTFAGVPEVEVTLFNAYTPLPQITAHVHEAAILDKLKSNLSQLSQKIKEHEKALNDVKQQLVQKGFADDQIRCIYRARKKDTAGEIMDLAAGEHFDLIVINHKPGKFARFFTGSVYHKLVNGIKDAAICIVN